MDGSDAMGWIDVGAVEDMPLRGARCLDTPAGRVGLFRVGDGRVFAVENRCPHKGGPLSEGIVHGAAVSCPLHNWVISLETGQVQGHDEGAVRTFPVRVEEGRVLIAGASLTAQAAA